MKIVVRLLIVLVVVFSAFSVSKASGQMFFFQNSLVNDPAPDFTLDTLTAKSASLAQLRGDKPAIIFFWATWCPHCRSQLSELSAKKADIESRGIKVFLVDLAESKEDVQSYVKRNKIQYDSFIDADSQVAEKYSILGVPTFIFVNPKGIVTAVEHALMSNYEDVLLSSGEKKE